jgi:hypothetical protein
MSCFDHSGEKRLSFRNGSSFNSKVGRNDCFGYTNNKNFVLPFLAALHKTAAIVNFPANNTFQV